MAINYKKLEELDRHLIILVLIRNTATLRPCLSAEEVGAVVNNFLNLYYIMVRRLGVRRVGGMRRRIGGSFFGNVWNGIKKAANFVKDNKLISKGLALIPHPGAQAAAKVAGTVGIGRRRRRVYRRRRGGAMPRAVRF